MGRDGPRGSWGKEALNGQIFNVRCLQLGGEERRERERERESLLAALLSTGCFNTGKKTQVAVEM